MVLVALFAPISVLNVFSQTAEPKNVDSEFLQEPFNPNIERLPVGFMGHNHKEVIQGLTKLQLQMMKGEFETTEEYKRRNKSGIPLFGSVLPDSTLAFVALAESFEEVRYDADRGIMTIQPSGNYKAYQRGVNLRIYTTEDYISEGRTGLGIPINVRITKQIREPLLFPNRKSFKSFDWSFNGVDVRIRIPLPPLVAREVKDYLGLVFIGKLASYEVKNESGSLPATVSSPSALYSEWTHIKLNLSEFWVVDMKTGQILLREIAKQ